jgi:hypothetical protein
MQRLDFRLPDFTRFSWASDDAREVWEPRFQRIAQAWSAIEWMSVVAGVRGCGLTTVSPAEFVHAAGNWIKRGIFAVPIELQGVTRSYSSTSVPVEKGKPVVLRVVLGTPDTVAQFRSAWEARNQERIGKLLGYPDCCYRFFRDVWVEQGMVDTTWPMALRTSRPPDGAASVEVDGPPEANILWRWMGIRAVPHLPCRFDCEKSVELGKKLIAVGRNDGWGSEMDSLLEILSWPVEWSSLHGIAEVKTPLLRVSTRSDAVARKLTVRRKGDSYPSEGARGLKFPHRTPPRPLVTLSRRFRRGLENPIRPSITPPEWYAADNGFQSVFAMDREHLPIVDQASAALQKRGGDVLDLGCGNGALLKKIRERMRDVVPFGIDCEDVRVEHACTLHSDCPENFISGNMFEEGSIWAKEDGYRLIMLMPGRLLEAETARATRLRARLRRHGDLLLVYAYGEWLTRHGSLAELARRAGLRMLKPDNDAKVGLATVEDTGG